MRHHLQRGGRTPCGRSRRPDLGGAASAVGRPDSTVKARRKGDSVTATDTTTIAISDLLSGTERRESIGMVGVDSGTMAIGAANRFPDPDVEWYDHVGRVHDGVAYSSAGYGDGGYDAMLVKSVDGEVVGVEAIFICAEADALAEKMVEVSGVHQLSREELRELLSGEPNEELQDASKAMTEARSAAFEKAYEEILPTHCPTRDSEPQVLGTIKVAGSVGIGDPCYGSPTQHAELPAGSYVAVVWNVDAGHWGNRVGRLGVYRTTTN